MSTDTEDIINEGAFPSAIDALLGSGDRLRGVPALRHHIIKKAEGKRRPENPSIQSLENDWSQVIFVGGIEKGFLKRWGEWEDEVCKISSILTRKREENLQPTWDNFHEIITKLLLVSSPREDLLKELNEIFLECSVEDWNGYGARPLLKSAYLEVKQVIINLPSNIPFPDIVPEPTGEIGLEWRKKESGFLISFKGENIITFAGIFGKNDEIHGIKKLSLPLPKEIVDFILTVFAYEDFI